MKTLLMTSLSWIGAIAVATAAYIFGCWHYVKLFENNCEWWASWAWLSFPVAAVLAVIVFRMAHRRLGWDPDRLSPRTKKLVICLVLPWISAWLTMPNMTGSINRGRQKRTMSDMRTLGTALEQYRSTTGSYPTVDNLRDLGRILEDRGLLKRAPVADGWQNEFIVVSTPEKYMLVSAACCGDAEGWTPEDCPEAQTADSKADIVHMNGSFVRWPEGTQR